MPFYSTFLPFFRYNASVPLISRISPELSYYKMVQNLCKNWLLVSKVTWEIWTTSDKEWKVQKVEIRWVTFVQKYIPSAEALYTADWSNITFNYLCENSPIPYVIFEIINHFSRHNSSVNWHEEFDEFWLGLI